MQFDHNCCFIGCSDSSCLLCRRHLHISCKELGGNFKSRYIINRKEPVLPICGQDLLVTCSEPLKTDSYHITHVRVYALFGSVYDQLQDVLGRAPAWSEIQAGYSGTDTSSARTSPVLVPCSRGKQLFVNCPENYKQIPTSSSTLHEKGFAVTICGTGKPNQQKPQLLFGTPSGTKEKFRLLAVACTLDATGKATVVDSIQPAVSEAFRVVGEGKVEAPLYLGDEVELISGLEAAWKKLKDLRAFLDEFTPPEPPGKDPEKAKAIREDRIANFMERFTEATGRMCLQNVGDFLVLLELIARMDSPMTPQQVRSVLKLGNENMWQNAERQARMALASRAMLMYSIEIPEGSNWVLRLSFPIEDGRVNLATWPVAYEFNIGTALLTDGPSVEAWLRNHCGGKCIERVVARAQQDWDSHNDLRSSCKWTVHSDATQRSAVQGPKRTFLLLSGSDIVATA